MVAVNLTVADYRAGGPWNDADDVTIVDTGANIASLTPDEVAALAAANVDAIDASDNTLALTAGQATSLGTVALTAEDAITIFDTGANLNGLSPDQIAAFAASGGDAIDASDDALSIDIAQLIALGSGNIALNQVDVVTLAEFSVVLNGPDPAAVAALAGQGVDRIDAIDDQLTYSAAAFNALGTVQLTDEDAVTIGDTSAVLELLSTAQIAAMAAQGVDTLASTDQIFKVNVEQLNASGVIAFQSAGTVTAEDSGASLGAMSVDLIASLNGKGLDSIDASDDVLDFSVSQFNALGTVGLTLADAVTIVDSGANLGALSAGQIAALAGKNVDAIDATDNVLNLSVAQLNAFGTVKLTAGDTVTLADAGTTLSSLSPAQIAALGGNGVDVIDASDNVLSLTLAQFVALGSVQLTAGDTVTLTDTGSVLSGLSPSQIGALGPLGIDAINVSGVLTLNTAQYDALGIPLVGGTLSVVGTSAPNRIFGTAGNDSLKGFGGNDLLLGGLGNDKIFGGFGKDTLTGNGGRDAFVFDTKLNKKTNIDKITDFNVRDDSVYLDNAIFKKLGRGTEESPKKLSKAFFTVGSEAKDRNDYLIYDKKKGVLYYDQDGSGSKAQVEIATLKKNLKMTYNDFFVI